ncbi:hypothetical protein [Labrys miyagiensis]|uniref:hypothetical protein n=1 Tax=Labrys miyagiensis TaxID=346912 RepID=UPI0024E0E8C4|nr:hypothetical protein [Labrys miyagiensis]
MTVMVVIGSPSPWPATIINLPTILMIGSRPRGSGGHAITARKSSRISAATARRADALWACKADAAVELLALAPCVEHPGQIVEELFRERRQSLSVVRRGAPVQDR